MTADAAVGASVGAGGLEAIFALGAHLGERMDGLHSAIVDAGGAKTTRHVKTFGVATTPSPNPNPQLIQVTSDQGPSVGYIWNLRGVGVFGVTDAHTNVGGSYEVYAGALLPFGPGINSTADVVDLVAVSQSIPAPSPGFFTFTGDVFWVRPTETIYAIVYAAPVSTQLALVALCDEYKLSDVEALSI